MTVVQASYALLRPLDDTLLRRIADAHGHYGILRALLAPSLDKLTVDYDASRLTLEQLESVLRQLGLPVRRIE